MGCNCGGSARRIIVHESHRPDGTVKRFLTEAEARRDALQHAGHYAQITQVAK